MSEITSSSKSKSSRQIEALGRSSHIAESEIPGIYLFEDYREYLVWRMNSPSFGRGSRQKLAQYIECQPSFVSQVLSGQNELSLEHAFRMNHFFHHGKEETQYFITMVQLSKAGTFDLQKYFRQQLKAIREQQMQVQNFVHKHQLNQDDLIHYYSNWECVAAHMLVTIGCFQVPVALQNKLQFKRNYHTSNELRATVV